MTFVIGLTGVGGVGKTTTANAICVLKPSVLKLHIGTPLKAMLHAFYTTYGLEDDEVERRVNGDLKRHPCPMLCGRTPTEAQQTLGTEWGRELLGSDLWLNWWTYHAAELKSQGFGVINDSVRFANEADAIREMGGKVIRLTGRGGIDRNDHASEKQPVRADLELKVDEPPLDVAVRILSHFR